MVFRGEDDLTDDLTDAYNNMCTQLGTMIG